MTKRIPILLTSSVIAHDAGVSLKDAGERARLTLESIREWLKIDPHLFIVVCDGSNFDFTPMINASFPGAAIECLRFENDQQKVRLHGRGYGEGEIVRHAVENSHLISDAGCFAKCTAKLWISNFHACTRLWKGRMLCKGVFLDVFTPWKRTRLTYIDTRFYVVTVAFYRQYFLETHLQVRSQHQQGLEECFLQTVWENDFQGIFFPVAPVIEGVGGGTGKSYRNSLKRRIKEDIRLWLVRQNSSFQKLFCN